jgi:hypothetical protein
MPAWILLIFAGIAAAVPASIFFTASFLTYNYQGYGTGPEIHTAPGPLMGAGLPLLLVAGGYWVVRRYRGNKANEMAAGRREDADRSIS